MTYQPDPNYCNEPGAEPADAFTYTLNGGSTARVEVTVTCMDEAQPVPTTPRQRLTLGRMKLNKKTGVIVVPVTCNESPSGPCTTDVTVTFRRRGFKPVTKKGTAIPAGTTLRVKLSASRRQRARMRRIARLPVRVSATNPPGEPVVRSGVLRGR